MFFARRGWVFALAALAVLGVGGCGKAGSKSKTKRIVILTNGNSPFWDAARAGMEKAAEDLKLADANLAAVLDANDGSPQGQINKLRDFGNQPDIAAIGISAVDAANASVIDELRHLQERGVKIVTIDSDVDREKFRDVRYAFIGTDNLMGGRELGITAKNLRPEGGEYVTFVGREGAQNAIERIQGFAEGAGEKLKSQNIAVDDVDLNRARANVTQAMSNFPNLNVLVGIWSYNAPAIVEKVREAGRRKDFTVVAFDAEPNAVKYMGDGDIDAMVVQNPFEMGYQGVKMMKALLEDDQATLKKMLPNHGQPNGDLYDTGLKVVVPDAGSPLKKDMFNANTAFLTLNEFKAWLEKYGLTGS